MCESLGALRCADINRDLRATLEKALSSRATQAAAGARNQHHASGEVMRHLSALLTVNYSSHHVFPGAAALNQVAKSRRIRTPIRTIWDAPKSISENLDARIHRGCQAKRAAERRQSLAPGKRAAASVTRGSRFRQIRLLYFVLLTKTELTLPLPSFLVSGLLGSVMH